MTATTATRELTTGQRAACKHVFKQYQTETDREPDAWRRLGQAFAEMGRAVYLPPEKLARRACVPLASTEHMEDWHRTDRQPGLSSIYRIGAYFGVSEGDVSDFIHEPVAVSRKGAAGRLMHLFARCAGVTLLAVGHRLHIVSAETVATRLGPLAMDTLSVYGWYSGSPGAHPTIHLFSAK